MDRAVFTCYSVTEVVLDDPTAQFAAIHLVHCEMNEFAHEVTNVKCQPATLITRYNGSPI